MIVQQDSLVANGPEDVPSTPADGSATPEGPPAATRGSWVRRTVPALICLAIYLVLATLLYSGSSWLSSTRITGCACGDQAQEVWFLAWPPFALAHGHNLFFSAWIDYPTGMNLSVNTSMPLLGIVGAPITRLFGPVATYNVLLRLGFALSAFSLCLVLRRWTDWWPAAFFGGLTYGFSAYMVGQGLGHLNLVFVPFPPLMLLVLHEIVVRRRWSVWRSGGALGLLATAQFLISPEILLSTAVAGSVAIALAALARRREVVAAFGHAARGLAWAFVIAVLLLAYPTWMALFGPQHVVGPPNPLAILALYPGDALGTVVPTVLERMAPAHLIAVGSSLTGGSLSENGMYLGLPLLVTVVAFVVAFRRRSILVLSAAVAVCTWILSLGAHLTVDRHVTTVPLPFDALLHVPVLQDMLPVRFSLLTALFTGAVLALGLDMLRHRMATGPRLPPSLPTGSPIGMAAGGSVLGSVVALVLGCIVALSLLPRSAYGTVATEVPPFFTGDAVQRIPAGSTVLTYPYPAGPQLQGMLDQAVARMRYKITGAYGFVPDATGHSTFGPPVLPPAQVQMLFYSAFLGGAYKAANLPSKATAVPAIRTYLAEYNVSTVIFYDVGADPSLVLRYMTAAIGPPTTDHGTTGWFEVPARLRAVGSTTAP